MAGPTYYDAIINIALNEDWVVPFQYGTLNADGSMTPIDLTGSTLKMEIRANETDHEALVSVYSPNNGIVVPVWTDGQFAIALTRDKLWRLFPGTFVVDLVRLMPSGYQERIFEGSAIVDTGTTR